MPAWLARTIALLVWPVVSLGLARRAAQARRTARPLTAVLPPHHLAQLSQSFPQDLLADARIHQVITLTPVIPSSLVRRLKLPTTLDLSTMRGMCYGDLIVVAGVPKAPPLALIFHELVHTCQYRVMGRERFLRRYLFGYLRTLDYWQIDLELQAYDLQARMADNPDVMYEVNAMLGRA
jgi:hypothetical protein